MSHCYTNDILLRLSIVFVVFLSIGDCLSFWGLNHRISERSISIRSTLPSIAIGYLYPKRNEYTLRVGSSLNLTCAVSYESEFHLSWNILGFPQGVEHRRAFNTLTLIFDSLSKEHSGSYRCHARGQFHSDSNDYVTLHENVELSIVEDCAPGFFECEPGSCIEEHLVCDGFKDCWRNRDESHCWQSICDETKIFCPNGRCMDRKYCCSPKVDENCTRVLECCKPIMEFYETFDGNDETINSIIRTPTIPEKGVTSSTRFIIIACCIVFVFVFCCICTLGICHSKSSGASAQPIRVSRPPAADPPRPPQGNAIPPPPKRPTALIRPPSYRSLFGPGSPPPPPPPYSEGTSNNINADDSHIANINNNEDGFIHSSYSSFSSADSEPYYSVNNTRPTHVLSRH